MIDVKKFISDRTRPENTVHYGKTKRFSKAIEQYGIPPIAKEDIIKWTNEFIMACGIEVMETENQIFTNKVSVEEFNKTTKERYSITNKRDIIWMKFANTGHLGVVACSNDVNFDIPSDKNNYDEKLGYNWKYNTSGIILHYLNCHNEKIIEWDQSSFLVFPLRRLENGKNGNKFRHQIETGIGNYLISKEVPILDYYSHRI
ncbi:MAG: hypothetical protein NC433_02110 [Clostridiales bacterium]|nr:hypothetical protein [Clostridiales bacterium]